MNEKVIVRAHTKVIFTFEEEGHLTMKELRDKVKKLIEPTNGKVKDIKLQIVGQEEDE